MVVAMIAVRVMEMAVDQVVDVIAVRYLLVPAAGAVDMARLMAAATRRALVRIVCTDLDRVLVDMIAMRMMQMAIVQIVDVVAVLDCGVSAARAMLMVMVSMVRFVAWAHACLLVRTGTFDDRLAMPLRIRLRLGNLPGADRRHPETKPERVARSLTILPADHEGQSAALRPVQLTHRQQTGTLCTANAMLYHHAPGVTHAFCLRMPPRSFP
ncbi:hypothetical protein WJ16_26085 [Burkholderia metallica]|nr:hypothetical protein WJ16_26085 [Burkholderia metallica]